MEITLGNLSNFKQNLIDQEKAESTVQRYMSIVTGFYDWLEGREVTKESLIEWRKSLQGSPSTVNVAIAAVNRLTAFLDHGELHLRRIRVQRAIYRSEKKELKQEEYERLIHAAEKQGKERLARAIEAVCALGIRVSELSFLTVEALKSRGLRISNKGKTRTVLIVASLTKKLLHYCKRKGIVAGPVFITRSGRALGRKQFWAEMKQLSAAANVGPEKVFPHNLRHLFATVFYSRHKDVVRLADILGHSSVNTTRIYLMTSGDEHRRELEALGLVLRSEERPKTA